MQDDLINNYLKKVNTVLLASENLQGITNQGERNI